MSFFKSRESKKSATALRAVPKSPEYETGLHSDQRTLTTHAYSHSKDNLEPSRSYAVSSSLQVEDFKSRPTSKLESVFGNASLKGTIGTYKNGRIQWRHKDRESSRNRIQNGQSIDRTSRPIIQVVIPIERRNRPLPALPFFASSSNTHMSPASPIEAHDVSPPSANHKAMRDSIVSPLGQVQPQPMPFGHFQRSTSPNGTRSRPRATQQDKGTHGSSGSSNGSQHSDTSSVHSDRSSRTSVEADLEAIRTRTVKPSRSQANVQEPITTGVISNVVSKQSDHRIPPPMVPPRRYAQHTPIEDDEFFKRTCELQFTRCSSNGITRKPTLTRKSSKRSRPRRSLTASSNMGAISEAIDRSSSRQTPDHIRVASPTLSEAEDDLEEQLTSFTKRQDAGCVTEQSQASFIKDRHFAWDEVNAHKDANNKGNSPDIPSQPRKDSGTLDITNAPPSVPRKSSKRQSRVNNRAPRTTLTPDVTDASCQISRVRSPTRSKWLTLAIPEYKRMAEEFMLSPIEIASSESKCTITPGGAEAVILGILRSLDHLEDLFAAAVVNCGFYRVFKRHELELIKSTLRKMSPPAWEFREIAFPGHELLHAEDLEMTRPDEEYTPATYLRLQRRDVQVIRAIKSQIIEKCQSFLRPDISFALMSESPVASARVDDALWRIWSFCKIFGSGKGREEDIVAQMDWLKGGLLAHQDTCTSSFMTTDYMNDTLVGAPESFGEGNEGGLTAEELFDMMELWNCLGVLLQGLEGRTAEARKAGVYDCTDVRGGDIDGEEAMLDEWCYYLLTLGPSIILDLAVPCRQTDCSAFVLAAEKGWVVNWKPPVFGGTRRNFLKEAASRVYEDKIANTYAKISTRDLQRQQSKLRIQKHISELRHRKNTGSDGPMISMAQERPMSVWSTVIDNLTEPHPAQTAANNIASYIPTLRSSLVQELSPSIAELPASKTPPLAGRTFAQPLLPTPPPSTVPSNRDRYSIAASMPSIEEHPAHMKHENVPEVPPLMAHPAFRHGVIPFRPPPTEASPHHIGQHIRHSGRSSIYSQTTNGSSPHNEHPAFQQHQAQMSIYDSERHENTADKAIYRIVEMGFTADQAREALRMTDQGTGLRIDRAVELLLSRPL